MFDDYEFLGFGIRGYKSFTDESALVGPFGKVHLITGQNNSGKSALADAASKVFLLFDEKGRYTSSRNPFDAGDIPQRNGDDGNGRMGVSLCFSLDSLLACDAIKRVNQKRLHDELIALLKNPAVSKGVKDACWFDFELPARNEAPNTLRQLEISEAQANAIEFGSNLSNITHALGVTTSSYAKDNFGFIANALVPWTTLPKVIKVEAIRKTTAEAIGGEAEITGGEGLITELNKLRNPSVAEQYVNQRKWDRFISFVREVLNDAEVDIRPVADASEITVKMSDTDYLPLASLGTGIEELIILAAVVACNDNKLIYIEEPEIHLHPTLQAKIVRYLQDDDGGNRFIVTTHSPSIINCGGVTVTQVVKSGGTSATRNVRGIVEAREVMDDLGAHPADLLQANYVVWVEGPSDRIYVNYWLSQVAPELKEGTHYSVMIYGGKLLNACRASEDDANASNDLISLFRINTHFCVLMDSDRDKPRGRIAKTKLRIQKECKQSGCLSWITDGRTIENYVTGEALRAALDSLYPGKTYRWKLSDPYVCPLDGKLSGVSYKPDKIRVARYVTQHGYDLSNELVKHVTKLANEIRKANE